MADRSHGPCNCNCSCGSKSQNGFFTKPNFLIEFKPNDSNFESILDTDVSPPFIVKRKFVKLRIENVGGADAHNCSVELNVPQSSFNSEKRHPSDIKTLCWVEEESNYTFLGRKIGKKYVNIILSDSELDAMSLAGGGMDVFALASTKESVHPKSHFRRAQDAFGLGDFEAYVTVSGSGVAKTWRAVLHIDTDFERTTISSLQLHKQKKRLIQWFRRKKAKV